MLREMNVHTDWCAMTMSMMREKQFEACERRLFAHPGVALFSPQATQKDAQNLLSGSFDDLRGLSSRVLVTLEDLRARVLGRLPLEAAYLGASERELLEKLLIEDGELYLSEWDDIGAAEALVSRLWCGFRAEGDQWRLMLPQVLHEPLSKALTSQASRDARERLYRFDATIHGLLYIAGLLHAAQPMGLFMHDVMRRQDVQALDVARRYLQASFEYVTDANGDLILLHPGLADPYRMVEAQPSNGIFTLELSQEMLAGGINGMLPEEADADQAMQGALRGALRPEYELEEACEDLRMLAKQGVSLAEMETVMASMLSVLPTREMLGALQRLYLRTPHWMCLRAKQAH